MLVRRHEFCPGILSLGDRLRVRDGSRGYFAAGRRTDVPDDRSGGPVRTIADRGAGEVGVGECTSKRESAGTSTASQAVCYRNSSTQAIENAGPDSIQSSGREIRCLDLDRPPPLQRSQPTLVSVSAKGIFRQPLLNDLAQEQQS